MRRQKATQSSLHSSQQEILEEPQNKWTLTFLPWSTLAWFSAMNDIISIVLQKLLEFTAQCLKKCQNVSFFKDKTYSCFVFIFDSKFTLLDNFQILSKVILSCFLLQVSEFVLVFGNFLQRRLHTRERERKQIKDTLEEEDKHKSGKSLTICLGGCSPQYWSHRSEKIVFCDVKKRFIF